MMEILEITLFNQAGVTENSNLHWDLKLGDGWVIT